ncbi:MAG: TonB-dependent receptor [Pseudomonadota bacterium]
MKIRAFDARSAVVFSAVAAACAVSAQTSPISLLGEVVVTATRSPQPVEHVVADISIIDREQIERSGAVGLSDVLKRVPGIEISRNGGPATTTSVFLRGAESRFTAVYIDGVRVDSQSTGGAAWESIPLALIDRIEVLRGPAGAVYGSDALGGVIQVFTKRGEGGFSPYVGMGAGSHNTRQVEGGFSGASGSFDYALGLVHEKSDGFNARTVATQNPDKDGYRSQSANLRLGFQLDKAHRFEATYLTTDSNSGYDNGLGKDDRNLHKLEVMGLNWQAKWNDVWSTRLSATDSRDSYETTPSPYLTITNLRGYTLQNDFRLGQHLLTAAVERKEDHLQNAPIDQGRSQDALALGYSFANKSHSLQLNLRHDKDSEFGGKKTGSAAYAYAFAPEWRASASVGTAFRAPTLYQRFSVYGVPTLVPESSKNIELGLRWSRKASGVGLVAYRNKVDNLITFAGAGACASTFGCYANTARAEYSGATLTASHSVEGVNLGASLDLQNPRDLTTGKQLARRSRQHGTLTADYRAGAWQLGAEAQFSGKRFDDAANTQTLAGYSLFNLSASTPFAKDWTLLARVDNLSDKKYVLARTYATAGRSVYVGVKWAPK